MDHAHTVTRHDDGTLTVRCCQFVATGPDDRSVLYLLHLHESGTAVTHLHIGDEVPVFTASGPMTGRISAHVLTFEYRRGPNPDDLDELGLVISYEVVLEDGNTVTAAHAPTRHHDRHTLAVTGTADHQPSSR
ncbi:hypothetical protein GCM10022221_68240 [Actinocorallia aurea]